MPAPRKQPGEHYRTPARQIGRVPDAEWAEIQQAAQASGKTLTEWALTHLLRLARRVNKR
jgi:hypothetical protein